jgi:ribosome-binding protein aMBF1 (putative translation factor)
MKAMAEKQDGDLYCSFCGRSQDSVVVLIRGAAAYICDLCVDVCGPIVQKHRTAAPEELRHDAKRVHDELQRMARVERLTLEGLGVDAHFQELIDTIKVDQI